MIDNLTNSLLRLGTAPILAEVAVLELGKAKLASRETFKSEASIESLVDRSWDAANDALSPFLVDFHENPFINDVKSVFSLFP